MEKPKSDSICVSVHKVLRLMRGESSTPSPGCWTPEQNDSVSGAHVANLLQAGETLNTARRKTKVRLELIFFTLSSISEMKIYTKLNLEYKNNI